MHTHQAASIAREKMYPRSSDVATAGKAAAGQVVSAILGWTSTMSAAYGLFFVKRPTNYLCVARGPFRSTLKLY